jgi:hypothetical protein
MVQWGWRTLFLAFALTVGWCIHHFLIRPSGVFHWDEAAHSLKGLLIARDLGSGDWLGFLYDTYRQVYWPPLDSWFLGLAFLIREPTTIIARNVSLIFFLLSALMIYCAALQFRQRYREVGAAIATTLFLTSPLVISLSG